MQKPKTVLMEYCPPTGSQQVYRLTFQGRLWQWRPGQRIRVPGLVADWLQTHRRAWFRVEHNRMGCATVKREKGGRVE